MAPWIRVLTRQAQESNSCEKQLAWQWALDPQHCGVETRGSLGLLATSLAPGPVRVIEKPLSILL